MDGSKRQGQSPLAVQREFVGFRLEKQILSRVYELVVPPLVPEPPQLTTNLPDPPAPTAGPEPVLVPLAKGA